MAASDPDAQKGFVAAAERPGTLLGLLRQRYFRRLWLVTSVSSVGDWVGVFALTKYVADLSGRPEFAVGGVLLFRVIPGLFFGPFAGVLADRFDRRRLMIASDCARAVLIASIPWIHNLWGLYAVSAAMEVLQLLWAPSKDATLPNLVERDQLMTANQLSLVTTYATFPLGGAIVALLALPAAVLDDFFPILRTQPTAVAFFFDAASFLFAGAMVATFPREKMRVARVHASATGWNPFRDLAEGLRFVRKTPQIRTLVLGAWTAFTGGSAIVSLGPIFADRVTAAPGGAAAQATWGALIVAVGIGLVLGMVSAGIVARFISRDRIFPVGLMLSGASTVLTAGLTTLKPTIPAVVGIGVGAGIAWVTIFTLLQERTDDRLRGRTFATLQTGIQLSLFTGLAGWPLIAGAIGNHTVRTDQWIIDLSGVRLAIMGGGLFLFASGALTARGIAAARNPRRAARFRGLRLGGTLAGGQRPGLFVVFEGVEGAGKSTQMKLLYEWLRAQGRQVIVTREPGGTTIAERVRQILLDPAHKAMDPKAEALLYAASRAQHVAETIRPALERGAVVLCDRYIDSSLAYQGVARGLGEDDVLNLSTWATDHLLPDVVVLLHLDPEAGLARASGAPDRLEQETIEFHRKVGDAYIRLARAYPSRFTVVDATAPVDSVQQQIRASILPFLREAG